jgi:pyruvate kinase
MMASMTENPEPSRAEVSDVATAVLLGADCVMLSDETASGKYPFESVSFMRRIIVHTEKHLNFHVSINKKREDHSAQASISKAIISLAENINAKAIVVETKSGATAKEIASRHPKVPIIAVTSDKKTAQLLTIIYGIRSYKRPIDPLAATKTTDWLRTRKIFNKGDIIVTASGKYPGLVGTTDTIKVRALE